MVLEGGFKERGGKYRLHLNLHHASGIITPAIFAEYKYLSLLP